MSQHDLNIANQGFPAFRADLNDALVALGSTNSGATAPATPYANQLWYDTANNILKIRNEDNDAWISIATLDQSGDLVASFTATNITAATAFIADTINEKTSAAGVTIDGVLLKDGEINAVGVVKALGTSAGGGELRAYEDTDNGTNFVSLKAPATLAADRTFVLPSADGTSGQALTTDGSGNLAFSSVSVSTTLLKNRIINGAMVIDQRNAGASIAFGDVFPVDRWNCFENGSMAFTGQRSTTAPAGFTNSLLITTTTAASPAAASRSQLLQVIEGYNIADLGWGTANAKTITISFWVRSSLTGQFGGAVANYLTTRSYPFSFTISAANTFEYKTITIAGDTTGTWNTENSGGINLSFDLGMGSDLLGTAGAWAGVNYRGAIGDVKLSETSGATFYITGVQLEVGTQATSFEYRQHGTELALCQRYYQKNYNQNVAVGASSGTIDSQRSLVTAYAGSEFSNTIYLKPTMRAIPSISLWSDGGTANSWTALPSTSLRTVGAGSISDNGFSVSAATTGDGSLQGMWAASAEL
jgi:hypothetical protein